MDPSFSTNPVVHNRVRDLRDTRYANYLDPSVSLDERLLSTYNALQISEDKRAEIACMLAPLKIKHFPTYEHCLRVGLLSAKIGSFLKLDAKALLYAGLLHDVGKALMPPEILNKTSGWTQADREIMSEHVIYGYNLVRGKFDFSAEIILWHHRFQKNGYPLNLPPPLHNYSSETRELIPLYGRLLAIADSFDALHRLNDRNGFGCYMTGEEIKVQLLKENSGQSELIESLFVAGVFTMQIYSP